MYRATFAGMHPVLVAISNVWQVDARIDALKAEHEALSADVARATQARAEAEKALLDARVTLDAVVKAERASARELDSYAQKRDATRKMINEGTAPDYAAAERQLAQCIKLVDELETTGLDLLEQLDGGRAALAVAEAARTKAEQQLAEAKAALAGRDGPIRAELGAALKAREVVWPELPSDYHSHYGDLRRRKRPALVNVVDGTCTTCHMHQAPQRVNDVQLDRAVHTCPGCGGYLLPS